MTDDSLLTKEEKAALALLAKNRRLLIVLVPNDANDAFTARLTAWSNYILDTKIIPPLPFPLESKKGDGLTCAYCGSIAATRLEVHDPDCEWRKAMWRWGAAQMEIDEEFGGSLS